jgi:rubrerythrin
VAELKESGTLQNLIEVFAREAQILSCYHLFAKTAEYEGLNQAAELFKRLEQNQAVYVQGHLGFLRNACDPLSGLPFGQTEENLAAALAYEEDLALDSYPASSSLAETEGFATVSSWLQTMALSKQGAVSRIRAVQQELSKTRLGED